MSVKSILLITPTFPPYQGSHTQRMLALARALLDADIEVSILTTEILEGHPSYNAGLIKSIPNNIHIYRTPYGKMHKNVYTKVPDFKNIKQNLTSKNGKHKFLTFLNRIKNNIAIPDTMIDWYYEAIPYVRKEKIIDKVRPDYIYSCAMPYTSHLIGYKLSKKYKIPLITDYADPWVYISGYNYGKLRFYIEKYMETRILSCSSLISFSTKGAELLYIDKFHLDQEKTITAMTGFDKNLSEIQKNYIPAEHDGIILTYGGALQKGVRDPIPFFKAIKYLQNDKIIFNLRTDDVEKILSYVKELSAESNIHVKGYIPFEDYFKEMLDADIIVFFGNSTSDQLPGKIFNYLPTRKPILYISNIPDGGKDQTLEILRDYGNVIFSKNDEKDILDKLQTVVTNISQYNYFVTDEKIEKYSAQNQWSALAHKVKEMPVLRDGRNNL